mmetsp:Transcript_19559/g.40835  ORF Transcript_19559/g.40835 Transcript_19559/m.40835 type:complete len:839 (-) Transcript_19559:8-2524(-)
MSSANKNVDESDGPSGSAPTTAALSPTPSSHDTKTPKTGPTTREAPTPLVTRASAPVNSSTDFSKPDSNPYVEEATVSAAVCVKANSELIFTGKTCMQCRVAKVKCDKHQPCDRCNRRGYACSAQARGPGRPPAAETKKKRSSYESPEVSTSTGRGKRKKIQKSASNSLSKGKGKKGSKNGGMDDRHLSQYPTLEGMAQHQQLYQHPGMSGMSGMPGMPSMPGIPGMIGLPQMTGYPGAGFPGFPGQIPPQMHPAYSQQFWHPGIEFPGGMPMLQQMEQPDGITSRFLSLVTSGAYTTKKIEAVVSMLASLAFERSSATLSRTVLEARSLSPTTSVDRLADLRRLANSFNMGSFSAFPGLPSILDGIPTSAAPEIPQPPPIQINPNDGKVNDFISSWMKDLEKEGLSACRVTWEGKTTYRVSKDFGKMFFDENLAKRCYAIGQDPWFNLLTTHDDGSSQNTDGNPFFAFSNNKTKLFEKAIGCIFTEPPMKMEFQRQSKLLSSTGHYVNVLMKIRSELSDDGRGLWQVMKMEKDPDQKSPKNSPPKDSPPSLYPLATSPFAYTQNPSTDVMSVNARVVVKAVDLLTQNNIGDLLELCTENVFIDSGKIDPVVSIFGTYIGKRQVAKFCESFHAAFIVHSFKTSNFQPSGNVVKAVANYEFTSKINSVRSKVPHKSWTKWMFNDEGKISGLFIEVTSAEWIPYFQTSDTNNQLVKDIGGLGTALLSEDSSGNDDNVKLLPRGDRESARDWKAALEMFTRPSRAPAWTAAAPTIGGSTITNSSLVGSSIPEAAQEEESSSISSNSGFSILDQLGGLTPQPGDGESPVSPGSLYGPGGKKS